MKIDNVSVLVSPEKIQTAVDSGEEIEIIGYTLSREFEEFVNNVLTLFLACCHQEAALSTLSYSSEELLANANKANAKRVFFQDKGLDIENPDDYKEGMITFSTETTVNKVYYQNLQKENDLYIKYILSLKNNVIKIEVINKATLTDTETKRIHHKMDSAKKYSSMEEALTDIDKTEGSGLGLIIIILMLKQIGIQKECLQVESTASETIARIVLPVNEITLSATASYEEEVGLEFI